MSHFAEIDNEGVVLRVIVAEQDFINSGAVGDSFRWIQTSFNTKGGKHYPEGSTVSDGDGFRKNFAGEGFTYDKTRDAFIQPKTFPSWVLNETTCQWIAPTAYPDDDKYYEWDEETTSWKEIE
tara:strand:+ start:315 stop:683 length:369 start_codon:yes stop_codon:yes gene_type:complete